MTSALSVEHLCVDFSTAGRLHEAVTDLTFEIQPGEILALAGESGSGKSVTALAVLGLLPRNARRSGEIHVAGTSVVGASGRQLQELRGGSIGMVFQEPMTALNPVFTVGWQITEAMRLHGRREPKASLRRAALEVMAKAGIPEPERRFRQYPHELSGGLRQRVMIAIAICNGPALIIADEATTALDVTVQAEVLSLLRSLRDDTGVAMLVITHNMGVVADIADTVAIMRQGRLLECAPVGQLFERPEHSYTRELLSSVPRLERHPKRSRFASHSQEPTTAAASVEATAVDRVSTAGELRAQPVTVLSIDHLIIEFGRRAKRLRAVDDVSLSIASGEIVALVGESGSGKSTVGRAAVGLYRPRSGSVSVLGSDLGRMRRRKLRAVRRQFAVVLQDPAASLDPRMSVLASIVEPMVICRVGTRRERYERGIEALERVRLGSALADRFPHELSGGQRQRASIARALVMRPKLVVADEPTSALDVSVQASVLDLFLDLQDEVGFACLFISHDLAVVSKLADRVLVMHRGRIVEQGERDAVLFCSTEPYTRQLMLSAPVPDPVAQRARRVLLQDEMVTGAASSTTPEARVVNLS